ISGAWRTIGKAPNAVEAVDVRVLRPTGEAVLMPVKFRAPEFRGPSDREEAAGDLQSEKSDSFSRERAPIRTTSPGLTVCRGGAVTPRFSLIRQHLNGLDVWRQQLNLAASYTPLPKMQLEVEIPVSRTSFNDGVQKGLGSGIGNITFWAKYRFFR